MISLREAERFHGHLGPWLVLGILAGEIALKKIKAKKYFGLEIKVWGVNQKPRSCLIDGLQLSTGATYGKGNIKRLNGPAVKIEFCNRNNNKKIALRFKDSLIQQLEVTKTRGDSQNLAWKLYKTDCSKLFNLTYKT